MFITFIKGGVCVCVCEEKKNRFENTAKIWQPFGE